MFKTIPTSAFTAVVLALLTGCASSTAPPRPAPSPTGAAINVVDGEWAAHWNVYLERAVPFGFSGGVLAANGETVLLRSGYGLADRSAGVQATGDTVFYIGSLTKQFTAAAIMKLMDDGKLSPQDPVTRFFRDVPQDKQGITLHQLLSHTSGLPAFVGNAYGVPVERDAHVAAVLAVPLEAEPGNEYLYSNAGYSLLAATIEAVSGIGYEQFVHDHLLRPAGMMKTGYVIPDWNGMVVAHGYDGDRDTGSPLQRINWTPEGPTWAVRGAGNMLSTLGDMHRWSLALNGTELLSEGARKLLYEKHVQSGENSWYGYGWAIREIEGIRLVSHNGSDGVFYAVLRQWPDNVLIGWTNQSIDTFLALDETLARNAIHKTLPEQLPPELRGSSTTDPTRWTGRYLLGSGDAVEIRNEAGGLMLEPFGQAALSAFAGLPSASVAQFEQRNRTAEAFLAAVGAAIRNPPSEDKSLTVRLAAAIRASTPKLGQFVGQELIGSVPRRGSEGVQTFGRFRFGGGTFDIELEWKGDAVDGAGLNVTHPSKMILRSLGEYELAAYNFRYDSEARIHGDDTERAATQLTIETATGTMRATRSGEFELLMNVAPKVR